MAKLPRASIKERCCESASKMARRAHLAGEPVFCRVGRGRLFPHPSLSFLPLVFSVLTLWLASGIFQHEASSSLSKTSQVVSPLPVQACVCRITCPGITHTIPQQVVRASTSKRDAYIRVIRETFMKICCRSGCELLRGGLLRQQVILPGS